MSDFTQRSRSYPDARLFEIVREAEKYAAEAVVAAEVEIERRGLQAADFSPEPASKPFGKLSGLVEGLKRGQSSQRHDDVIDWVDNPVQESKTGQQYLRYLMIVTGLHGLYALYDQLDYILFVLGPLSAGIDEVFIFIILGVLFQAFLVFLLWQRKRIGFQITAGFTAFGVIGTFGYLLLLYQEFGTEILDTAGYLLQTLGVKIFTGLGLTVASIWLISRKELQELFGITRQGFITIIAIGLGLGLVVNLISIGSYY